MEDAEDYFRNFTPPPLGQGRVLASLRTILENNTITNRGSENRF